MGPYAGENVKNLSHISGPWCLTYQTTIKQVSGMSNVTAAHITLAKEGDAAALEHIVRAIQDRVYRLATRMLADPDAAQDATQEILIRVVTKLSTYRGDSKFDTWVYRVATNYLLTARKVIANDPGLTFPVFLDDLKDGLADETHAAPEDHVLLNDLRVRCTMAMLLCLDRDHRAAYVLGEILELDHSEAADILDVSNANFRQRLSRARKKVQDFTASSCGLAGRSDVCSCPRRLGKAIETGRLGSAPTETLTDAPAYAQVKTWAHKTQSEIITAKLQRATGPLRPAKDFATDILRIVDPPG